DGRAGGPHGPAAGVAAHCARIFNPGRAGRPFLPVRPGDPGLADRAVRRAGRAGPASRRDSRLTPAVRPPVGLSSGQPTLQPAEQPGRLQPMPYEWISMTTDYGVDDGFVAACKGVIARLAPQVRII